MAACAELSARPPRIPKLTYRNQLLPADSDSSSFLNLPVGATSSSSDLSSVRRPSTSAGDSVTGSFVSIKSTSSSVSVSSLASSNVTTSKASRTSSKPKKKKKNGVLNFLSVKEPSQVAFEQYMKEQREQTATKNAHKNIVGLQTISTQKLPSSVPRVNSKWDGVPEAAKSLRPSSQRNTSSSHGAPSMQGFDSGDNTCSFTVPIAASRGPPPSISSAVDITGRKLVSASETSSLSSASASPLPERTCYFPDQSVMMSGALPISSRLSSPLSAPQDAENGEVEPVSETLLVNPIDEQSSIKADAILRKLKSNQGVLSEAKEVFGENEDDQENASETHGFLFDFQTADERPVSIASSSSSSSSASFNPSTLPSLVLDHESQLPDRSARNSTNSFSRPRPFCIPSHKTTSSSLPTLYEVSIASSETIAELSEITANTQLSMEKDEDTISISDSLAPSVMSASWYRSSKDRLGLGSRISKKEALPWEDPGKMEKGKPKRGRLSVFSKKSG